MPINFSNEDKVSGAWIKWDEIGKKVQGTLIGRRQKPDTYDNTKMQWIYELLTEDGDIIIVGGKPGIDMQMKHVRLGQIIELRYEGDKPSKMPGYDPTKLIQLYTRADAMDKEWLEQNKEMVESGDPTISTSGAGSQGPSHSVSMPENNDGEIKVEEIPFDDQPAEVNPIEAEITKLAKEKLKVVNDADVQKVVMENTGLAFIKSNLSTILEKLKAM